MTAVDSMSEIKSAQREHVGRVMSVSRQHRSHHDPFYEKKIQSALEDQSSSARKSQSRQQPWLIYFTQTCTTATATA